MILKLFFLLSFSLSLERYDAHVASAAECAAVAAAAAAQKKVEAASHVMLKA